MKTLSFIDGLSSIKIIIWQYADVMETTAYYIKLEAHLSARGVYYKAFWDGKTFRMSGEPWICFDKADIAEAEFVKVLATIKPDYWSGCYQIGIWKEVWQDNTLILSEYLQTYQTPAFPS